MNISIKFLMIYVVYVSGKKTKKVPGKNYSHLPIFPASQLPSFPASFFPPSFHYSIIPVVNAANEGLNFRVLPGFYASHPGSGVRGERGLP